MSYTRRPITIESATGRSRVGPPQRDWRKRRRMSQLELALEADVSPRHLSFVETGRSRPSAEIVLQLAAHLDVPLRDRKQLLLAAGYAPVYGQRGLDDPEMGPVRDTLELVLRGHDPTRRWSTAIGGSSAPIAPSGC